MASGGDINQEILTYCIPLLDWSDIINDSINTLTPCTEVESNMVLKPAYGTAHSVGEQRIYLSSTQFVQKCNWISE